MYDFTDGGESDIDPLEDSSPYQMSEETDREWNRMSDQFANAGYREGITAGKESALQEGFDVGFADTGAPIGRQLGNLRGLASGLLSFVESSRFCENGSENELLAEIRGVIAGLARLQFNNLALPDEEALMHAREHVQQNGTDPQIQMDTSQAGADLPLLSSLRVKLEEVLGKLKLDALLPIAT